jgi:hypothetical protein
MKGGQPPFESTGDDWGSVGGGPPVARWAHAQPARAQEPRLQARPPGLRHSRAQPQGARRPDSGRLPQGVPEVVRRGPGHGHRSCRHALARHQAARLASCHTTRRGTGLQHHRRHKPAHPVRSHQNRKDWRDRDRGRGASCSRNGRFGPVATTGGLRKLASLWLTCRVTCLARAATGKRMTARAAARITGRISAVAALDPPGSLIAGTAPRRPGRPGHGPARWRGQLRRR